MFFVIPWWAINLIKIFYKTSIFGKSYNDIIDGNLILFYLNKA